LSAELIALLLAQPLTVRLALLDADPTGPWWRITHGGVATVVASRWPLEVTRAALVAPVGAPSPNGWATGGAWLPCNPLAIAEHAQRLCGALLCIHGPDSDPDWVFELMMPGIATEQADKCPHTAAVRLLAEVVG
jgi:hypothetical protein